MARPGRRGGEDRDRAQQLLARRPSAASTARPIDERTRARHAAVHALLGQGVGLLECARRLGWALNTVKRYARAATAEHLARPPRYGRTLVDPYRDHLRRRLAAEPDVAVTQLLAEIRELGYTGSANLLMRYLNQGRAATERAVPAPRRLVSWIMTRPADLPEPDRAHLDQRPRRPSYRQPKAGRHSRVLLASKTLDHLRRRTTMTILDPPAVSTTRRHGTRAAVDSQRSGDVMADQVDLLVAVVERRLLPPVPGRSHTPDNWPS